jgi:hypothetical protein
MAVRIMQPVGGDRITAFRPMYQYSALLWEMGNIYLCLLQTPQTLKLSRSCHNEKFMVGSPRWGLYALKNIFFQRDVGTALQHPEVAEFNC